MTIEFLPWYAANEQMLRCEGDNGCGALVMSDDIDRHLKWHDKVAPRIEVHINPPADPMGVASMIVQSMGLDAPVAGKRTQR